MTRLPLAVAALALAAVARAATPFPISCRELSERWTGARSSPYAPTGYYDALRPDWAKRELRCDLLDSGRAAELQQKEIVDVTVARAAYVLDTNRWARSASPFRTSLVSDGWPSGPPESMFNWVRINTTGLVYGGVDSGAKRSFDDGHIYLAKDNFTQRALTEGYDGIALALQLAHEAEHAKGGHVLCSWQKSGDDPACDSDVVEQFTHIDSRAPDGSAHGFAAMYAVWIAQYSDWPPAYRRLARDVSLWVMGCCGSTEFFKAGNQCGHRINNVKNADAFTCRYFGVHNTKGTPPCRR